MNDKCLDTYEKIKQSRRDQLIEQCLNAGMPVTGDEDEETLEMYVEMAYDDIFDLDFVDDEEKDDSSEVSLKAEKTTMFGKIVSLFM